MIRIVKMTFRPDAVEDFLEIFNNTKERIRNFEGCEHLKLLQGLEQPNVLFTYSIWKDPSCLEEYRNSELFSATWKATKALFEKKAEAWSVEEKFSG